MSDERYLVEVKTRKRGRHGRTVSEFTDLEDARASAEHYHERGFRVRLLSVPVRPSTNGHRGHVRRLRVD